MYIFFQASTKFIITLKIINGTDRNIRGDNFPFPSISLWIWTISFLLAFFPTSDVIKNHLVEKSNNCGHSVAFCSRYLILEGPFAPSSGKPLFIKVPFTYPQHTSHIQHPSVTQRDSSQNTKYLTNQIKFVFLRTLQRRGVYGEDLDYPPMEPACFSPTIRGRPPHWDLEPPPPYEVAIKTTTSSTRLRRSYSDTHLLTEPLFGRSREISFEV